MKGLLVWSQSSCRSVMGLYRALGGALGVPVEVAVWFYKKNKNYVDNRNAVGFCGDEFSDMTVIPVGEDFAKGMTVLDAHSGWTHLFCNYQGSATFRHLQLVARRRGERTAIGSESPCNMFSGWRKWAKEVYFRTKLPRMTREVIEASDFFVNYSGNDDAIAKIIGWPNEKIIPFGYFPPPIPGTQCFERKGNRPFEILATGELTWHRGSDVLVDALSVLKQRSIPYHATITQQGPLLESLKVRAKRENLPIDFTGFMPMPDLHRAYETCSVYVGAGRHEPWGMRLNDALNCGAPLVVSRGMGGVKMVDDYGCGLSFGNEDAEDLARKLESLATDDDLYKRCASRAVKCAQMCSPENKALELATIIKNRFPIWAR